MAEDVSTKVKQIIAEQLGIEVEEIADSARLAEDLKADEIDIVVLEMAFKSAFSDSIDDPTFEDQIKNLATVEKIVDFISTILR